jgi:hypothetical protein
MKTTIATTLAAYAFSNLVVQAEEIKATPELIERVQPYINKTSENTYNNTEYHFRRIGDHILFCIYANGGNGHFCRKVEPYLVGRVN